MEIFAMKQLSTAGRLLVVASGSVLASAAYAAATVDPASQPFHTLAPYVLESSNLEPRIGNPAGGTLAYRPWFENGAWTGDLIQYFIDKDGRRSFTGGTVGQFPRDGENWNAMGSLWSARYVFPDFEWYDVAVEADPAWECVETDADYWRNRSIFTVNSGARVPFLWNALAGTQRAAIDSATYAAQALDLTLASDPYASPVLNFVRGDRSRERCKETGIYRWRFSVLGAIVNSRPVYVPAGEGGLVVVGANDGMLHGFAAKSTTIGSTTYPAGGEMWGYVPSMLIGKVGALRVSPYRPAYFVDGELRHGNIGTIASPRHIVSGGLGAGAKGLFILDATSPAAPGISLELSGHNPADSPYVGGSYDPRIGYIHGRPTIARFEDGGWYVVSGNGYASSAGNAQLVIIPLNADGSAGTPQYRLTDGSTDNGLSAPALVDTTGNGRANYAYAGDLRGNLWRFDLKDPESSPVRLFVTDAAGNKPITAEPDIAQHPDGESGFMVYFGTGSLLSSADATNKATQSVYGIWDRLGTETVSASQLVEQNLVTARISWVIPTDTSCPVAPSGTASESSVRLSANPRMPDWKDGELGWRVDLPRAGERLIGRPQVRAERLQFITTNPWDMENPVRPVPVGHADYAKYQDHANFGGSWMLQLDLASGATGRRPRPLFDLNDNCVLDAGDGLPATIAAGGYSIDEGAFPIGVHIGPFNVAQPAFARVSFNPALNSVVDGVYINALQMPRVEPVDEVVHGPLDVTTDSARGLAHAVASFEALKAPFQTDTGKDSKFPQASGPTKPYVKADGLGHRVDGHSFGYNKHHGVDYVDLFALEPQRDKYRLDIGAMYFDGTAFKPIPTPTTSEQELNRVTEVGIDAGSQKFIVVLTNADLSRENEIKIGCRSWPVYEYQTIVMQALRTADPMAALASRNLIFTLGSILAEVGCAEPTLRITPTDRIGNPDATMHTLPGCVNNTDLYFAKPPAVELTRKADLAPLPSHGIDPHVTKALEPTGGDKKDPPEWQGYRWRNGALTIQLLAVNPDNSIAFTLQDWAHLPTNPGTIEGVDFGWGGAYAKAFNLDGAGKVIPITDGMTQPPSATSGMLYELSMFWHWGDMARFQASGSIYPVCLGAPGRNPRAMWEGDWFTPGAYGQLTKEFTDELQALYLALLAAIRAGDADALLKLAEMFEKHPGIADYHRMRHYVPNSKQLKDHHLIGIDRGAIGLEALDGTPAPVVDIEADLLPSLGPNFQPGRRSWIDIAPE
jgi:hypothetical protein